MYAITLLGDGNVNKVMVPLNPKEGQLWLGLVKNINEIYRITKTDGNELKP
jgi:hypothetical protein